MAAGRALRAAARGGRPRQAQARLLLRRGPPAVRRGHRRLPGVGGPDRAADPLEGRGRLLRHPGARRHARRGARPARQPGAARAARLHPRRRQGAQGGGLDLPDLGLLRRRGAAHPDGHRRGGGHDPVRGRRAHAGGAHPPARAGLAHGPGRRRGRRRQGVAPVRQVRHPGRGRERAREARRAPGAGRGRARGGGRRGLPPRSPPHRGSARRRPRPRPRAAPRRSASSSPRARARRCRRRWCAGCSGCCASGCERVGGLRLRRPALPPFTEEHEPLRAEIRAFVAERAAPARRRVGGRALVSRTRSSPAWASGVCWGSSTRSELGGRGGGYVDDAVLAEELSRCGSGGLAAGIGAHIVDRHAADLEVRHRRPEAALPGARHPRRADRGAGDHRARRRLRRGRHPHVRPARGRRLRGQRLEDLHHQRRARRLRGHRGEDDRGRAGTRASPS